MFQGCPINRVNDVLAKYFAPFLNGDNKCFDVHAELDIGAGLLFGAVITHAIVANTAMSACRAAIRDRDGENRVIVGGIEDRPRLATRIGSFFGMVTVEYGMSAPASLGAQHL